MDPPEITSLLVIPPILTLSDFERACDLLKAAFDLVDQRVPATAPGDFDAGARCRWLTWIAIFFCSTILPLTNPQLYEYKQTEGMYTSTAIAANNPSLLAIGTKKRAQVDAIRFIMGARHTVQFYLKQPIPPSNTNPDTLMNIFKSKCKNSTTAEIFMKEALLITEEGWLDRALVQYPELALPIRPWATKTSGAGELVPFTIDEQQRAVISLSSPQIESLHSIGMQSMELLLAAHQLGQAACNETELELTLSGVPVSRVVYYLDLVRQSLEPAKTIAYVAPDPEHVKLVATAADPKTVEQRQAAVTKSFLNGVWASWTAWSLRNSGGNIAGETSIAALQQGDAATARAGNTIQNAQNAREDRMNQGLFTYLSNAMLSVSDYAFYGAQQQQNNAYAELALRMTTSTGAAILIARMLKNMADHPSSWGPFLSGIAKLFGALARLVLSFTSFAPSAEYMQYTQLGAMMHSISWYHVTAFVSGYNISQLLGRLLYVVIKDIQPPGTNIGVVLTQVAMGSITGVLVTLEIRDFSRRPEQLVTPMVTKRIEHTGGLILEERTTWTTRRQSTKTYFLPFDENVCTLQFIVILGTLPAWEIPASILQAVLAHINKNKDVIKGNSYALIDELNREVMNYLPAFSFDSQKRRDGFEKVDVQIALYKAWASKLSNPELKKICTDRIVLLNSPASSIGSLVTMAGVKDQFKKSPLLRLIYAYMYHLPGNPLYAWAADLNRAALNG